MYSANGVYYTEEHSVSFGDLIQRTSGGKAYTDFDTYANTWEDWCLIPSSLPVISNPTAITKYVDIPGMNGQLDLSDYLVGRTTFSNREGALSFLIDTNQLPAEVIREKMMEMLHGKVIKMQLADDPAYYYEGRFSVGNLTPSASYPSITINYKLDPYKYRIAPYGSESTIWDTFNFETDYDYSVMYPNITVNGNTKRYTIYANDFPITPTATWISGSVTVAFGGVSKTLNSAKTVSLGTIIVGHSNLVISGTGSVLVEWRGGSL